MAALTPTPHELARLKGAPETSSRRSSRRAEYRRVAISRGIPQATYDGRVSSGVDPAEAAIPGRRKWKQGKHVSKPPRERKRPPFHNWTDAERTTVVTRHDANGETFLAIAKDMGLTEGQVRGAYHTTLRMRRRLEES